MITGYNTRKNFIQYFSLHMEGAAFKTSVLDIFRSMNFEGK